MSDVRLYVDEDAGEHAVVQGLRARGLDVLTTIDANRCGSSDRVQLAFAVQHGRAIHTFFLLLRNTDTSAGERSQNGDACYGRVSVPPASAHVSSRWTPKSMPTQAWAWHASSTIEPNVAISRKEAPICSETYYSP